MQLIANMYDDIKLLVDIQDFQTNLATAFETKGLLSQYRNDSIPAPNKKNLTVKETKIKEDKKDRKEKKDTPEKKKAFDEQFDKEKITAKDDTAIQKEVTELAMKLAEEPNNADAKVGLHKDIRAMLGQKKMSVLGLPST